MASIAEFSPSSSPSSSPRGVLFTPMMHLGFFHIKTGIREYVVLMPPTIEDDQISLTFETYRGSNEFTQRFEEDTQVLNPDAEEKLFQIVCHTKKALDKIASANKITKVSVVFEVTSDAPHKTLTNGISGLAAKVAGLCQKYFPNVDPSQSTFTVVIESLKPYRIKAPELFEFAAKLKHDQNT